MQYNGRGLSKFRTLNTAKCYIEISDENDVAQAFNLVQEQGLEPFVLGAGSNVFFRNKKIKSAIIKNNLPKSINHIKDDLFEVSASVDMLQLLNFTLSENRDCCYYLASAPCQVGGAIAMNAGSGKVEHKYICNFIKSVKYFDGEKIVEKNKEEIFFDYRTSEFLHKKCFIISAIFEFPQKNITTNPIRERLEWAKKNQDLSQANCGSMCNTYNANILKFVRFLFAPLPCGLSKKKLNWAQNKSKNPFWLRLMFGTIKALHKILHKRLKFEIIFVD